MPYKDPAKQREYQRLWMKQRRDDWIASKGGVCAACGSTDRLEVDHIDPTLKTRDPAAVWGLTQVKRDAELANCQVLCYTHHLQKTQEARTPEHGTDSRYRTCHCDLCKHAHKLARSARRARGQE